MHEINIYSFPKTVSSAIMILFLLLSIQCTDECKYDSDCSSGEQCIQNECKKLGDAPVDAGPGTYYGDILELTVAEAEMLIESAKGKVVLIMFYASTCPRSEALFPVLVEFASENEDRGYEILAFSTNNSRNRLMVFLSKYEVPFRKLRLLPREPGTLAAMVSRFGINLPDIFSMPFVAVLDKNGSCTDQWEPAYEQDFSDIEALMESAAAE